VILAQHKPWEAAASLLIAQGLDVTVVEKGLWHSSGKTTLDT
jgi:hypothetical protein